MIKDHVEEIRNRYKQTNCTFQSLADEFGMSQTTVGNVIRGIIYAELLGPISKNNLRSVLTDKEVEAIRKEKNTHQKIADKFGVSCAHVSRIRSNICRAPRR